ncbi:MAG: hypothetical protein KDN19_01520 [Verrucomicrobiae bacterium]|nr:hypothetical protein [Verrucomicrobiae bacterium]
MARAFTAVVIAILMANPFCCCAAGHGSTGAKADSSPATSGHSCCQSRKATSEKKSDAPDSDHHECQCAKNQRLTGDSSLLKAPAPLCAALPALLPTFPESDCWTDRDLSILRPEIPDHPPPNGLSFSVLYGVYRC